MARKVERWLQEVFPGEEKIYSAYSSLSPRELPIVAAAVLDVALLELLERRLLKDEKEQESFLGTNGDGRAPIGSLGARIQLAYLLGILTENDVAILRAIKNLRNLFAHRVEASFVAPAVVREVKKLNSAWRTLLSKIQKQKEKDPLEEHLGRVSEAGEGLFLAIFTTYHAYLHRLVDKVEPVNQLG